MIITVKHMVCNRCIKAVEEALGQKWDSSSYRVRLGQIEWKTALNPEDLETIDKLLSKHGFELVEDEKSRKVEWIKQLIINEVHHQAAQKPTGVNFSEFISKTIGHDYSYLNDLFSSIEGKTIGQYVTLQKIEKAKELLVYGEMSLAQIADQLEYNSAQYLSAQFKKTTGLTPSRFKSFGQRRPIDKV
ncbi:helix-turn-helix domain-containing protein [Roseivirga thermotolerans]|uniref:HTH araC/xylS-type domain-containing protein n=1 Tax=Roseivirga thermotolerans TaxID=1758176 RepID=A0ABQ3ICC4_9BACT|nr:helix-turn-helix transcriptional regulator [Roseivirga thermotolerans]GHE75323.1 hypothetical protein GCM10011340_35220 [Roseivirga thermotolerans]